MRGIFSVFCAILLLGLSMLTSCHSNLRKVKLDLSLDTDPVYLKEMFVENRIVLSREESKQVLSVLKKVDGYSTYRRRWGSITGPSLSSSMKYKMQIGNTKIGNTIFYFRNNGELFYYRVSGVSKADLEELADIIGSILKRAG